MRSWYRFPILFASSAGLALGPPPAVRAQDEAVVDALATILQAEDARRYEAPLFAPLAHHFDPRVRRAAALAMARIGDAASLDHLTELLQDPDSTVRSAAAFGLGLLGDTTALPRLLEPVLDAASGRAEEAALEAVTAVARIGGPRAGAALEDVIARNVTALSERDAPDVPLRAVGEAWRLGRDAPVGALTQVAASGNLAARRWAVYGLSRLRAPAAAAVMMEALDDDDALVRAYAARVLTRPYAAAAELDAEAVADRLVLLAEDGDPGVRINALRSLGSLGSARHAGAAVDRLADADPNVRVQALETLGRLGGARAVERLARGVDRGSTAERRTALWGLAGADRARALPFAARWILDGEWSVRADGATALGTIAGDTAAAWLEDLLNDPDGRVAARAFGALQNADSAVARERAADLLRHPDVVVRAMAADVIARAPRTADLDPLLTAYATAQEDRLNDARLAALRALGAVAAADPAGTATVERRLLARFSSCGEYLARRAVAATLPGVAAQWGPPYPAETGRDLEDYRDVVRRVMLSEDRGEPAPGLVIDSERGRIEIELFAADAPLTVNAMLELVDQRYFDAGAWHRVVPNFVIQDGDPRGDGWGGPGWVLRDEVNQHRYETGTVGMALSGADTGGSQFFITHAPQPHLDGGYTVVGRVVRGMDAVQRITQGDRIYTVRQR